jgi:hypothetical protein
VPAFVVSASRRTDIPAFFTPWLLNRVRAGLVLVRNPRNATHVMRVSLRPDDVLALVLWSRDYGRLIPRVAELDDRGLRPCFHFTLTGYGAPLEPRGPAESSALAQFEVLAARYGRDRVFWRYDPIVIGSKHDARFHARAFERLARRVAPIASKCILSFLDPYPSTLRGLERVTALTGERFDPPVQAERARLARELCAVAEGLGLSASACCEPDLLADGVPAARCIDPDVIRRIVGDPSAPLRDAPTRKGCGCVFARDIGAYHTCGHGCVYCYANESPERGLGGARGVRSDANHLGDGDIVECEPRRKGRGQLPLS